MAATPYPENLFHAGTAKPLALAAALAPPASGDIAIEVTGNAAAQGWPAIPNGQKMVITVGRATQYETKYLISSVSSGQTTSTLTVLEADRNYDGTAPTTPPAGTAVEHTVSATEMATINDHMRTKLAHGSDGQLVDQNSVQTLTNKTINGATLNDPVLTGARFTPIGAILAWPSNTIPDGFLACDGQTITAQSHPALFAIIGGTVPNLVDRFIKGGSAVNLTVQGSATKTITLENMPAHKHDVAVGASQAAHSHGGATTPSGAHDHGFSGTTGGVNSGATTGSVLQYATLQGGGARNVDGYNPFGYNAYGHTHSFSGRTDNPGNYHAHSINPEAPAITVTVTEATKGTGTPFNVEPAHIVLQYIICAKPQGA